MECSLRRSQLTWRTYLPGRRREQLAPTEVTPRWGTWTILPITYELFFLWVSPYAESCVPLGFPTHLMAEFHSSWINWPGEEGKEFACDILKYFGIVRGCRAPWKIYINEKYKLLQHTRFNLKVLKISDFWNSKINAIMKFRFHGNSNIFFNYYFDRTLHIVWTDIKEKIQTSFRHTTLSIKK